MMNKKTFRWLNLLSLILTLLVNALANILPINGITTGEVSDQIDSLFTPAGYVFSIWGLIYLALFVFAIYQLLPSQQANERIDRIGIWFILGNIFNAIWIFMWHYQQFALSLVMMLGLLVSLLMVYTRLEIGRKAPVGAERWLLELPFGIYLGWISVATIANVSIVLILLDIGVFVLNQYLWMIVVLAVGTALGVLMAFLRKEFAYPLVVIWAFVGIAMRRMDLPVIMISASIGALVVLLVLIVRLFRKPKQVEAAV
jgi:hypothetical protein